MPSASFPYNSKDYSPPMPVMEITLAGLRAGSAIVVPEALVDSGADATMLPISLLQQVKARFHDTRTMRGVTGHRVTVDTYLVTIQIGANRIAGVEAIAMEESAEAILGRDVLNQLELTLVGPAHELWITWP